MASKLLAPNGTLGVEMMKRNEDARRHFVRWTTPEPGHMRWMGMEDVEGWVKQTRLEHTHRSVIHHREDLYPIP